MIWVACQINSKIYRKNYHNVVGISRQTAKYIRFFERSEKSKREGC
jgi:hypothetical protein